MPFNDPSAGDKLPLDELNGSLLCITVHEHVKDIMTVFGESDAVRCDVSVIDGDHEGDTYEDTLVFPRILVSQLRKSVGSMVLGRLGQGVQKPGQKPPWTLTSATDEEKAAVEKRLSANIDENSIV